MQKISFVLLALFALSAQAETYKWKDSNGVVQYGSNPPTGAKLETVNTPATRYDKDAAKSIVAVSDVDALPYLAKNAEAGRKAYEKYLAMPTSKLFVACASGRFLTFSQPAGTFQELYKAMKASPEYNASTCHPYAYNNEVVWNRRN